MVYIYVQIKVGRCARYLQEEVLEEFARFLEIGLLFLKKSA